ncbi:MAG: L,D-transpeptidase [Actinomycetes bacterium]
MHERPSQVDARGHGRALRRRAVAVLAVLPLTLLAGCQGGSPDAASEHVSSSPSATPSASAAPLSLTVSPQDTTAPLKPSDVVSFGAAHGRLTAVSVTDAAGEAIKGSLGADHTSWHSTAALPLASTLTYRVTAVPANGGDPQTITGSFTTLTPKTELSTAISPLSGRTMGVGMPIVVRFNTPIDKQFRAAVQKALTVDTSVPVEGAWSWVKNDEVHWRPKDYWPAHTDVKLHVDLSGVKAGDGVYGVKDREVDFSIGDSMVSVVDVKSHEMTVHRNGKVVRTIPITTGKAGFLTRNGTKVILEKYKMKVMDSTTIGIQKGSKEYYRLEVPYAMRVTWSGEFVHAAPWSVGQQGEVNVSHGCVGMSMKDAIWLYDLSRVGDIIKVVNSPRKLEPGNGYTDWNVSWSDWLAGSAA